MSSIVIHVAVAENGVIGRDGGMPWKLGTDLARFKRDTIGRPVVMGRRTFQSIGKPLPGRLNVVISRDPAFGANGIETARSLEEAVERSEGWLAEHPGTDEVCVIGGGEIYSQAVLIADRMAVTHVLATVKGDTVFPPIDPSIWEAMSQEEVSAGPRDTHPTRHIIYRRRR